MFLLFVLLSWMNSDGKRFTFIHCVLEQVSVFTIQPHANRYFYTRGLQSCIYIYIYRVSHELRSLLRESVPYVKLYRYNPKHLYPKLNGYGDNGHRNVWASGVSTYCSLCDAIHVHCACPTTRHGNAVTLASALQCVGEL